MIGEWPPKEEVCPVHGSAFSSCDGGTGCTGFHVQRGHVRRMYEEAESYRCEAERLVGAIQETIEWLEEQAGACPCASSAYARVAERLRRYVEV